MLPNLAFHFSIGLNARHVVVPTMINQKMSSFVVTKIGWKKFENETFQ